MGNASSNRIHCNTSYSPLIDEDLEPEVHFCVEVLVKVSAESSTEQASDRRSAHSLRHIADGFKRALILTINGGGRNPPPSRCRLCRIAIEINEVVDEVECISMGENPCCYVIIWILTFLLGLLQPDYHNVESRIRVIEDTLACEISEVQRMELKRKKKRQAKRTTQRKRRIVIKKQTLAILSPSPLQNPDLQANMFSNVRNANFDENTIYNVAGNLFVF